jgi:hypothetical protein
MPLVIRDLGPHSMQIQSEVKFEPGESLIVTAGKENPLLRESRYTVRDIHMVVLWSARKKDSWLAGLRYADDRERVRNSWISRLNKDLGIDRFQTESKRTTIRISSGRPLRFKTLTNEEPLKGEVIDIGAKGMLVEAQVNAKRGEEHRFRIGPYESLPYFVVNGVIAHIRYDIESRKFLAGVVFKSPDRHQQEMLRQYITTLYLERKLEKQGLAQK